MFRRDTADYDCSKDSKKDPLGSTDELNVCRKITGGEHGEKQWERMILERCHIDRRNGGRTKNEKEIS